MLKVCLSNLSPEKIALSIRSLSIRVYELLNIGFDIYSNATAGSNVRYSRIDNNMLPFLININAIAVVQLSLILPMNN
jgi:hypothetical protein